MMISKRSQGRPEQESPHQDRIGEPWKKRMSSRGRKYAEKERRKSIDIFLLSTCGPTCIAR